MSVVLLYVVLMLPGANKPIEFEFPMSAAECLGEVNYMTMQAVALHRPGKIQVSCIVVTDEKQIAH